MTKFEQQSLSIPGTISLHQFLLSSHLSSDTEGDVYDTNLFKFLMFGFFSPVYSLNFEYAPLRSGALVH